MKNILFAMKNVINYDMEKQNATHSFSFRPGQLAKINPRVAAGDSVYYTDAHHPDQESGTYHFPETVAIGKEHVFLYVKYAVFAVPQDPDFTDNVIYNDTCFAWDIVLYGDRLVRLVAGFLIPL